MSAVEITSLSSKGQVVIPNEIRHDLKIVTGDKFAVISDGENILLRPIEKPKIERFRELIRESRKYVREIGLKKDDIKAAIRKVRHENRG
jgi:AbrB family looped-hinge helix DNA binding protein